MRQLLLILIALFFVSMFFFAGWCVGRLGTKGVKASADTIYVTDSFYIDAPVIIDSIMVPVPIDVDTAAILQAYYTKNMYNREIISTPQLTVNLIDTVYNNRLLGSMVNYKIVIPQYKHDISIGFLAGYNALPLLITYRYDRWGMSAGYDLLNRSLIFGANYRLFRW